MWKIYDNVQMLTQWYNKYNTDFTEWESFFNTAHINYYSLKSVLDAYTGVNTQRGDLSIKNKIMSSLINKVTIGRILGRVVTRAG